MDSMCHAAIQLNEQDRELLVDVARYGYLRRELLAWGRAVP